MKFFTGGGYQVVQSSNLLEKVIK